MANEEIMHQPFIQINMCRGDAKGVGWQHTFI